MAPEYPLETLAELVIDLVDPKSRRAVELDNLKVAGTNPARATTAPKKPRNLDRLRGFCFGPESSLNKIDDLVGRFKSPRNY